MNKAQKIISLFLLASVVVSCRPAKIIKRETALFRKADKLILAVNENDIQYKTLSLKANISVSDGSQKISFKAIIRMEKDKVIWSSLSLLGIAGAKTIVSPDSIKLVNYKDKKYVAEKYETLQDWMNSDLLTFANLQNLLIGNWLRIQEFEKYKMKIDEGDYVVSTLSERRMDKDWLEKKIERFEKKIDRKEEKDSVKAQDIVIKKQEKNPKKYEGLAIEVNVDPYELKTKKLLVKDYFFEGEILTEYSDFKPISEKLFPHLVKINVRASKELMVEIEYYKISLDEEISTPFSIPSKYERVNL
jgi:hypothetical protein